MTCKHYNVRSLSPL